MTEAYLRRLLARISPTIQGRLRVELMRSCLVKTLAGYEVGNVIDISPS